MATPAVDAVIDRMDLRLREMTENRDGRRRFLRMYCIFKRALRQNIVEGRFLDRAWAEALCCRMADYYFDAVEAYDVDPARCPEPWRHSFERARSGRTNLLQDMLLGMNAHINYDLPLATYDTLRQFGDLTDAERTSWADRELRLAFDANLRRRNFDFLQTNNIAWQTIPEIQDVMCADFSRLLGLANVASFRLSGRVVERLICEHRDRAWSHTLLLAMADDAADVETLSLFISEFAEARARLVDRLTLSPIRFAGALRAGRRANGLVRRHVRLLVDHLDRPLTARAARRALLEYGPQAHSDLAAILSEGGLSPAVGDEILGVLAEHPSRFVAETTYRQWLRAAPRERGTALRLLGSLRREGVSFDAPRPPLLDALREEARRAGVLAGGARDVGSDLLREALGRRLAEVKRTMAELAGVLGDRPDSLPEEVRPDEPLAETAQLGALASDDDPWLQGLRAPQNRRATNCRVGAAGRAARLLRLWRGARNSALGSRAAS